MKRLFVFFLVAATTLGSTAAVASLSRGDKSKLGRYLTVALNPFAEEKDRQENWKKFTEFFGDRNEKDLAEVEDLTELLANSTERPTQRSGQYMMQCDLSKLGRRSNEKWDYFVNVPKRYSAAASADAWPLIVVLPDKGQKLEDAMEKYWKNEEIRDGYLIAVISMDYSDIEETQTKEVEDDDGKIKLKPVTVKVPFHWDSKQALFRFWTHLINLQLHDFKVNPNRVILDGIGIGREGAVTLAAGTAWRFGGLIDRGLAPDGPVAQNLSHLSVLFYPDAAAPAKDGEGEDAKAPVDRMKEAVGDMLTVAGDDAAWSAGSEEGGASLLEWMNGCKRQRYPLPSKWMITNWDTQQFGYWVLVSNRFEMDQPSEITISSERKSNTVKVDTKNVARFTLFLNDLLVDLTKPVKLVINGEARPEVTVKRSAENLLLHAYAHADGLDPRDPGCVFTAEMRNIEVAPPPAPKEEPKPADKGGDDKGDAGDGGKGE